MVLRNGVVVNADLRSFPSRLTACSLFLEADYGVLDSSTNWATANGTSVYIWIDQSGKNNTASQIATSGARPYLTNGVINSKSALYFDGSNDRLLINSTFNTVTKNISKIHLFVVSRDDAVDTASRFDLSIMTFSGGGGIVRCVSGSSGSGRLPLAGGRRLDGDSAKTDSSPTALTSWVLKQATLNYGAASLTLKTNGVVCVTDASFQTAGNTSNTDSDGAFIGNNFTSSATWTGMIAALVVTTSDSDATMVESYLRKKYGL